MNNLFNVKLASVKASHQNKVHKSREGEKKKIEEKRREKRANQFNDRRGIEIEENAFLTAVRTRAQRMEDYRQEKLKRREEIKKKTLPPFRAGIVHHTLDSPYKYFNGKESAPPPPPPTAATSTAFKFTLAKNITKKLTIPQSPKFSKIRGHKSCHHSPTKEPCPNTTGRPKVIHFGSVIAPTSIQLDKPRPTTVTRPKDRKSLSLDRKTLPMHPDKCNNQPDKNTQVNKTNNQVTKTINQGHKANNQVIKPINKVVKPNNQDHKQNVKVIRRNSKLNEVNNQGQNLANKGIKPNNQVIKANNQLDRPNTRSRGKSVLPNSMEIENEGVSNEHITRKQSLNSAEAELCLPLREMQLECNTNESVDNSTGMKSNAIKNTSSEKLNTSYTIQENTMDVDNSKDKTKPIDETKKDILLEINAIDETKREEKSLENNRTDESKRDENDEMNISIEIPEVFVKRKSWKASLRKNSFITPPKATISSPQSLSGPEFQRRRLNEERSILHKLCYLWYDTLHTDTNIPEDIRDEIDCVVGQTKLLTSDKFQQMSNLIDQYENQSEQAQPRILENDLDSFWDMIYIQVALMYKKFDRLKQLKTDQWIDKEEEERKRKQEAKMAKNKTVRGGMAGKGGGARSKLADFIRSKRTQLGTSTATEQPTEDKDDTKVFSGVFFHIESPVSNKVQKKVTLSSPAVKKQNPKQASIMNMLAVSPLAKSLAATSLVEVTTDATASEMRRGILKKTVERDQGGEGMKKKSTGRKSRGGKKICFSLVEPESAGEEPYFTPPQTPKRAIRKTPHKPPKSNHTDSEPNHTDNEPNHTNSEHMEVSPTLAILENQRPTRVSRTPQTKSARVSKTPQLGDENNSNLLNLSEESRKSPRRTKTPQKESPKTVLIGGENNNLLSVTEEFLTHKSPRGSKTPQKGSAKLSRTPPQGRNSPLLSIPADYLPRKSPRMSKAPERLTLDDFRITPKKSKRNFVLRPSRLSVKNVCT
ncbi:hypothetical protein M8J77_019966 [Diaphorina citri]|nr:hypothetical protein M8J77_019966 [Diaphorina citri]